VTVHNGIPRSAPSGSTAKVSGTSTGSAGEAGGDTMTSSADERSGPGVGQAPSQARRIRLLCWLLVLTMAATAECAWVVWLQEVWTVAPTVASPHPLPPVAVSERIDQSAASPEQ